MKLHALCESVGFLVGTWRGVGSGEYPTISPFRYVEEVTFGHVGKPFLSYTQKTKHADTGEPLHAESGYLRAVGDNRVELVVAQPSGIIELHSGRVEDQTIALILDGVHTTPEAKSVTDVCRTFWIEADHPETVLSYTCLLYTSPSPRD